MGTGDSGNPLLLSTELLNSDHNFTEAADGVFYASGQSLAHHISYLILLIRFFVLFFIFFIFIVDGVVTIDKQNTDTVLHCVSIVAVTTRISIINKVFFFYSITGLDYSPENVIN